MDGPPILPKGVVKNSPSIYSSLEKFKTEPLTVGEISELWKVYTTTKRRLLDPTAERLENYWWRIWGSRSRHLKAAIVVQIFADISEGQSFVPLTSQANRDEGSPPKDVRPLPRGASSTTTMHQADKSRPGTTPKQTVPPPSILKGSESTKKARNASTSGPKPTARFVSPHESEEELGLSSKKCVAIEDASSVEQDSKADRKLAVPSTKKKSVFIASGRSKRPVVVRRQSSQSSTDGSSRSEAQMQSSADRTPPNFGIRTHEGNRQRSQMASQDNSSSSSSRSEARSSARLSRVSDESQPSSKGLKSGVGKVLKEEHSLNEAGPSRSSAGKIPETTAASDLTPEEQEELELQRLLLAHANARVYKGRSQNQTESSVTAEHSENKSTHSTENGLLKTTIKHLPALQSKSTVGLTPALANAVGPTDSSHALSSPKRLDKGKGRAIEASRNDAFFSKRPVETFSSSSIPEESSGLSRSKSQLTLLLEKDRAKGNNRSASSADLKGKHRK